MKNYLILRNKGLNHFETIDRLFYAPGTNIIKGGSHHKKYKSTKIKQLSEKIVKEGNDIKIVLNNTP